MGIFSPLNPAPPVLNGPPATIEPVGPQPPNQFYPLPNLPPGSPNILPVPIVGNRGNGQPTSSPYDAVPRAPAPTLDAPAAPGTPPGSSFGPVGTVGFPSAPATPGGSLGAPGTGAPYAAQLPVDTGNMTPAQFATFAQQAYAYYGKTATPQDIAYWNGEPAQLLAALASAGGNGHAAAGGGASGSLGPGGGVSGDLSSLITGQIGGPSGINTSQSDAFLSALKGIAGQSLDVTASDPIIASQVGSYNAGQQNMNRASLQAAAEQGGPNANLGFQTEQANQSAAQNTGAFEGQLMQSELTARRNEVMQALSLEGNTLTSEQQLALTEELGKLNAALQYANLQQGGSEFDISSQLRAAGL